ncbi:hypothetical protein SERLADRAFT_409414 [Serpula lacrymans var. lacrymans S7.9]|uniref:Uncharacterized protein n=1 Tax=Serpula lacrymans var. lacrymans (strain S7.9) TaxID=578457 RepID=F8P150_SERL9|nr:uncharacterized protein SERLADRAFT_409414 [Serpula lacrymans var. lacrymans S7.9]EGO22881.1 hypothetical protein SERLADRAFT_409414 [Serpula lacrymans var. lacrymans S7.9]
MTNIHQCALNKDGTLKWAVKPTWKVVESQAVASASNSNKRAQPDDSSVSSGPESHLQLLVDQASGGRDIIHNANMEVTSVGDNNDTDTDPVVVYENMYRACKVKDVILKQRALKGMIHAQRMCVQPLLLKNKLLTVILSLVIGAMCLWDVYPLETHIQSFTTIEKEAFHAVLKFQGPQTKDSDIPGCTTLHETFLSKILKVEEKLWVMFKIGWTTSDNTSANGKAVQMLQHILDNPNDNDLVEDEDYDAGDFLGKFLAFVNQVRASPQAKAYFVKVCKEKHIAPLELIKWVRIQWGSMYDLLKRVITNKDAVNKFCAVADISP